MTRFCAVFLFSLFCLTSLGHAELPTLRVGVLKYGTVNWELQIIKANELDHKSGFNLEIIEFAGKQATTTAFYDEAVDVIVNDWIWVSRQRSEGRLYSFIPYSRMVGGLVVAPDRKINSVKDLVGKKIGIAGGPVDKSWLLFQAVAKKRHGIDLAKSVEAIFGAPPLLSKQLELGELDGVINFWHYIAMLEAKGFKRLLDTKDALIELGLNQDVPMIGYVFHDGNPLINAFSESSRAAKELLIQSPEQWAELKPVMKAQDDTAFEALKQGYLAGIPEKWDEAERMDAKKLFHVLSDLGGPKLVGKSQILAEGTFVKSVRY
jgi:NitT/TauT family transport system substrate-binding protein